MILSIIASEMHISRLPIFFFQEIKAIDEVVDNESEDYGGIFDRI